MAGLVNNSFSTCLGWGVAWGSNSSGLVLCNSVPLKEGWISREKIREITYLDKLFREDYQSSCSDICLFLDREEILMTGLALSSGAALLPHPSKVPIILVTTFFMIILYLQLSEKLLGD